MRPGHLPIAAAIAVVAILLYVAVDPGGERTGKRGGAESEAAAQRDAESARSSGSDPDGRTTEGAAIEIVVRPAGVTDLTLTGPRRWSGRTDEQGRARAAGIAPGRYAASARRDALVAARSFDVDGDTRVELELASGITVRGHVYGVRGEAVAGAVLEAAPDRSRHDGARGWTAVGYDTATRPPVYATATSGEDGAYALVLPGAGRYSIDVRARGYANANADVRRYDKSFEGVDFHLDPGAGISGRVVAPDGEPVAGASIRARGGSRRGTVDAYADSGADGTFRVDAPVGAWSNLEVHAHGFATHAVNLLQAPVSGLTIRLGAGDAVAVARLVVDGGSGQPAIGVEAQLSSAGSSRIATSDEKGVVRFAPVADLHGVANWRNLMVVGGGFVPLWSQISNRRAVDGVIDLGEFELTPGATIRGRVTDKSTGTPIEGAEMRWWCASLRGLARVPRTGTTTDREGRYELTGVPPDVVAVLALREGYATGADRRELFSRLSDEKARLLAPDQMLLVHDIELAPAARLFGVALDPEGSPLPGVVVEGPWASFLTSGATGRPSELTDADGRFEADGFAAGARVVLTAHHPRFGTLERINAVPGEEVRIRFEATTRVGGRVVDAEGSPVAGAEVSIPGARPGRGPQGFTGDDGRFLLQAVPPKSATLRIDHPQYLIRTAAIAPAPGPEVHDAGEFRLERGPGIEGRVVDENGAPLNAAQVYMTFDVPAGAAPPGAQPDVRHSAMVSTDADGRFSAYGLVAGNYKLTANVPNRLSEEPVVATGTTDAVVIVRRGRTWTGRVLVAGQPVERAFLSAQRAGTRTGFASGLSSADGSVVLEPLPADAAFDLVVRHQEYRVLTLSGVTAATLPPEIELDPGATIEGVVVEKGGAPIAGAHVQAQAIGEKPIKWGQANDAGKFVVSGLDPAKRYRVYVAWTRERHAPGQAVEVAPGAEPLRFELEKGLTIRGKLVTRDAEKLGNVRVVACDEKGEARATAWVFAPRDLAFNLAALKKGRYTLKVISGWGDAMKLVTETDAIDAGATDVEIRADG